MSKVLKMSLILISSIVLLLVLVILLLSVLFPAELVRKEIENYASKYLGTEVRLKKLSFSIFSGIELNDLYIKQHGNIWKDEYILNLKSAQLKYRLLPLLKKNLFIKACVIGDGAINLERNKRGANWDYFLSRFDELSKAKSNKEEKREKEKKTNNKKEITRESIPIDIDLKKIGLENVSINYYDTTFFDIPVEMKVTDVTLLAKNINVKSNKFFDLVGNVSMNIDGGKSIYFDSNIKSKGKLKIFDSNTDKIFLNGPIDIKLTKASIASSIIKELFIEYTENFLSGLLGPSVKDMLSDHSFLSNEAEKHFDTIQKNSKEVIDKNLEKINKIVEKKENILKYKDQLSKDFDGKINNAINEIDSKIDEIDRRVDPLLNTASSIPMIETMVDLKSIRNKVKDLKNQSKKEKDRFYTIHKNKLMDQLNNEINNSIPKNIPTLKEYENEFNNKIRYFKNDFYKNIGNVSVSSFLSSLLPEFSFMDKKWEIKNLSTTYYLNKDESRAEDINFNSEYFNVTGDFKKKQENINFLGDIVVPAKILKIDFLSDTNFKSKIKVYGDIKKPKVEIVELPKLEIDKEKIQEISLAVIKNFLSKDYGDNRIISDVLNKFSIKDVNEEELKNLLSGIKDKNLGSAFSDKDVLVKDIDKNIEKIINDLRKRVPGLR